MYIKQIDMAEAFRLAAKGTEIKTLVPTGPGSGWDSMMPDTLQNMLADVLFFRPEPAMVTKGPGEVAAGATDAPAEPAANKQGKKLDLDTGKLMALHKAGWPSRKIADELGVSQTTVLNWLKSSANDGGDKK